jgi:hypothetical protein
MTYKEWADTVPCVIREDPVWRIEAYWLALQEETTPYSAEFSRILDEPPMPDAECDAHAPRTTHHALES